MIMTLTSRNIVHIIGLFVVLFFFSLLLGLLYLFFYGAEAPFPLSQSMYLNLGSVLFLTVFSLIGWFIIRSYFKKTASAEMFFFMFFVISLSFETVRILQILLIIYEEAMFLGNLLTRIVFFGRFFGLLCLFFSGLFSSWLEFQRIGLVLSVSLLLPFALSSAVPVGTEIQADLMYILGSRNEVMLVVIALEVFCVLNYIFAAVFLKQKESLMVALGMAFVVGGRELMFFAPQLVFIIIGSICLILGSIVFGRKIHALYLWT